MWNKRYDTDRYVYGTKPNTFLAEHAAKLQGPVLCIAEGEGRNAVYLATLGLEVHAVDLSDVGLAKAHALAKEHGVSITTEVADLAEYTPRESHYGAVVSIFAHLPSVVRARLQPRVAKALRPGGLVLLEAYTEEQMPRTTGGPKNLDMLYSREKIEREFAAYEPLFFQCIEREVHEGEMHNGLASVVQFIGKI